MITAHRTSLRAKPSQTWQNEAIPRMEYNELAEDLQLVSYGKHTEYDFPNPKNSKTQVDDTQILDNTIFSINANQLVIYHAPLDIYCIY